MQTKAKSNSVITHTLGDDGCTITFKVLDAGEFSFDVLSAHANMQHRAAVHGFVQRIADGAAKSRDPETGASATPADKLRAMKRIAAHYASGVDQWALVRAEGSGGGATSIVVRALAEIHGMSTGEAEARAKTVAEKARITTRAYLAKMRKQPTVAKMIAQLAAADAMNGAIDADDLLDEFAAEGDE